jgi:hypothetical protein
MNIDLKVPKMHGDYTIIKRRNGKVLQKVSFHNTFTYEYFKHAFGIGNIADQCNVGSGSSAPSANDTNVTSLLWRIAEDSSNPCWTELSQDKLSRTWHLTYVIPASSSYVGTIREIGLVVGNISNYPTFTHALITDAEHNPIEIDKTYLDEVVITVAVTLTRPLYTFGFGWCFYNGSLGESHIRNLLLNNTLDQANNYCRLTLTSSWFWDGTPTMFCVRTREISQLTYDNNTHAISGSYEFDNTLAFTDYINSLTVCGGTISFYGGSGYHPPTFRVLLPNTDIFPVTTLTGISLGTGDGITTDFAPIIPAWVANSEIVYVDGVAMTRGIDYLVDNLANLGKFKSVMISNFICDLDCVLYKHNYPYSGVFGTNEIAEGRYNSYSSTNDYVLDINNPMIFTYDQNYSFSTKFNTYQLGKWWADSNLEVGASLVFYYSLDNKETWTELDRITLQSATRYIEDVTVHSLPSTIYGLTNIKVALEDSSSDTAVYCLGHDHNNGGNVPSAFSEELTGFVGYVGEYAIRFLTAPQQNAEITMDLDIDRPWKDNTVNIQWNPTFTFNI